MFLLGPGQQFDSELDTVAGGATMAQGDPFQGVESKSEEQGGGAQTQCGCWGANCVIGVREGSPHQEQTGQGGAHCKGS